MLLMPTEERNDAPGDYLLLTAAQVEAVNNPRTAGSAPPDAHIISRQYRGIGRGVPDLLPDLLPDLKPAIL